MALVAIPLYFNPQTARVFDPDKMALVTVLGLLAGMGLALHWAGGGLERDPRGTGPAPWHMGKLLALLGIVVFMSNASAGLLSETPQVAIWGAYRRAMGLIGQGGFLFLFLAALLSAASLNSRERFRVLALAPSLPVAMYAVLQRMGIDSLQWDTYGSSAAERAFGPLGNPIFLGAYLVMVFPLAISGWLDTRREADKGFDGSKLRGYGFLLAALASTTGILASQSRGPLLGWLTAIGVLALLLSIRIGNYRRARGIAAFSGLGLIILAWASQSGMLGAGRLGSLLSLSSRTVRERMLVWEALEGLARANPTRAILGYGPDSLAHHLPPHLDAALIQLTPTQYFDRAHNALWEAWVSGGLITLLAYLGLYLVAFGAGYKQLGLLEERAALGKLAGWMLAGAALGLFLPRMVGQTALSAPGLMAGWLSGAILYALFASGDSRSDPSAKRSGNKASSTSKGSSPVGALDDLRGADTLIIGILAMLSAHLVESALGLPTAAGELLFWIGLGVLGAGLFQNTSTASVDRRTSTSSTDSKRRKQASTPAGSPAVDNTLIADGLAEGLGLAAIAMAPVLLPSFAAAWGAWPIFLLVPAAWLGMDLMSAPRGWQPQRIFARLIVLALFSLFFVFAKSSLGGVAIAYTLVIVLATLAAAFVRSANTKTAEPAAAAPWRYFVYAALPALVVFCIWRLALRPVVADTHVRAALEAVTQGDLDLGQTHYESAARIWPEQPLVHVQRAAMLDQRMRLSAGDSAEIDASYSAALAALERARALAEDEVVLLRIASLHQTRGDLEREAGRSPAQHWGLARQAYAEVERRHPNYPPAFFGLGTLFERLEQFGPAGDAYASAGALDAGMAEAKAGALRCALAAGDQPRAIAAASAALQTGEDPAPILAQLEPAGSALPTGAHWAQARAMILTLAGSHADAALALSEAERASPEHPNRLWLREWISAREGP